MILFSRGVVCCRWEIIVFLLLFYMLWGCIGWILNLCCWKTGSEEVGLVQKNLFEIQIKDIWGKPMDLRYLKEKRLTMIVNVACK